MSRNSNLFVAMLNHHLHLLHFTLQWDVNYLLQLVAMFVGVSSTKACSMEGPKDVFLAMWDQISTIKDFLHKEAF